MRKFLPFAKPIISTMCRLPSVYIPHISKVFEVGLPDFLICSPPLCHVVAFSSADDDLLEEELDLEELGDVHGDGEGHDGEEVLHQAPPQLTAVVHRLVMGQKHGHDPMPCQVPSFRGLLQGDSSKQ